MPSAVPVSEGFVSLVGFRSWYRVVGDLTQPGGPAKFPLLVLHGGPGGPSDYLEPLEELADSGRPIIFYDQLGCGNSDQPNDPSLWRVELFLEELATVRQELGLDHIHLLGHSWGGMLAMEYALTKPEGLASLILASSPASIPQWIAEANRLRKDLPQDVEETLRHHEEAATTTDPAYEEAMQVFYQRHVCRLVPWPEPWKRALDKLMANPEVYNTMFGPSEFHATGTLKNWDIRDCLGEIELPTLVTSGRYDEATPVIAETVHRGIAGSEWVIHIEFWLANPRGDYDDAHRATVIAGERGEYRFESNVPVSYGGRPPHIHVRVRVPGYEELVTQHYPQRGQWKATFILVLVAE